MPTRRTLAAALAAVALAVPATTAAAQPADMHASTAIAAAKAQQQPRQDLRSPDARHAALLTKQHDSTAVAAAAKQDLRSPDAIDAAAHPRKAPVIVNAPGATVVDSQAKSTPVAPGQPTWAVNPQPLTPPSQTATATKGDDGADWTTIAIGVGVTLLIVGGVAALTARTRPTPRTPASA